MTEALLVGRLHLHDWNVLQGLGSQHSIADLHDKDGNDDMKKKINDEYCISVDGCDRRYQSIQGLHRGLLSKVLKNLYILIKRISRERDKNRKNSKNMQLNRLKASCC